MAQQKAVQKKTTEEEKKAESSTPKDKRSRPGKQIKGIREKGKKIADGGGVKAPSSIKWG